VIGFEELWNELAHLIVAAKLDGSLSRQRAAPAAPQRSTILAPRQRFKHGWSRTPFVQSNFSNQIGSNQTVPHQRLGAVPSHATVSVSFQSFFQSPWPALGLIVFQTTSTQSHATLSTLLCGLKVQLWCWLRPSGTDGFCFLSCGCWFGLFLYFQPPELCRLGQAKPPTAFFLLFMGHSRRTPNLNQVQNVAGAPDQQDINGVNQFQTARD